MDKEALDYSLILEDCGLGKESANQVVKNIANLEEFYDTTDLISIYNYCLLNIKDSNILIPVIRLADAHRSATTLTILIEMLKLRLDEEDDNVINVRSICVKAIANYKDPSTLTLLLDCLNNKNENYKIRLACADALGRMGDRYAVRPLLDVVEDETEKSVYLKESATFALGLLGDSTAIEPLITILESKQGFLDKFTFLKERIVEALGKLNFNNKKVLGALKKSLLDPAPIVRINAIEAIMNSGDDSAFELIKPSLKDEDDEVKRNALIALYNIIGRDILDEVISLPSYSNFLKKEAKEIINEYEDDNE